MGNYIELIKLMTRHPEVLIFRTYSTLRTQNILYLQAELAHLEDELKDIQEADRFCNDPERSQYHVSWEKLTTPTPSGQDSLQWALVKTIREKLAEYGNPMFPIPLSINFRDNVKDTKRANQRPGIDQPSPNKRSYISGPEQLKSPPEVALEAPVWGQLSGWYY
jgi:hypothetical protein